MVWILGSAKCCNLRLNNGSGHSKLFTLLNFVNRMVIVVWPPLALCCHSSIFPSVAMGNGHTTVRYFLMPRVSLCSNLRRLCPPSGPFGPLPRNPGPSNQAPSAMRVDAGIFWPWLNTFQPFWPFLAVFGCFEDFAIICHFWPFWVVFWPLLPPFGPFGPFLLFFLTTLFNFFAASSHFW